MRIKRILLANGETVPIRFPMEGYWACPVCGALWNGELPYEETAEGEEPRVWLPSYNVCCECNTEYGYDDAVIIPTRSEAQENRWKELRIAWLNKIGWPEAKLKQLETNLEADIDALKKEAGRQ